MKPIRFGIVAALAWALLSLLLVALSVLNGNTHAWVELDFRMLSGVVLIAGGALGFEQYVSDIIIYSQIGMPITVSNVVIDVALAFVDGFVCGVVIAAIYNRLTALIGNTNSGQVISFGISAGIVLGISSFLLAIVSVLYNFQMEHFDFTVRPVSVFFLAESKMGIAITPDIIRDSYTLLPKNYPGALWWLFWGFVDGFIGGAVLYYLYINTKNSGEDAFFL